MVLFLRWRAEMCMRLSQRKSKVSFALLTLLHRELSNVGTASLAKLSGGSWYNGNDYRENPYIRAKASTYTCFVENVSTYARTVTFDVGLGFEA